MPSCVVQIAWLQVRTVCKVSILMRHARQYPEILGQHVKEPRLHLGALQLELIVWRCSDESCNVKGSSGCRLCLPFCLALGLLLLLRLYRSSFLRLASKH